MAAWRPHTRASAGCVVALLLLVPVSLDGWGMEVHRQITARAIDGLPADIRPFFEAQRGFIVAHSVDPDLWRVVELRGELGPEEPNHFLDIDGLDEPRPFTNVPRDWTAYVAKHGIDKANRMGRLPWRAEEIYRKLVTALRDTGRGTPAYAPDNARYLVAVLSHYIEDAHQPFHAVLNYDGQLTGQRGIHSRFETELVLRNVSTLKLAPVTIKPITDFKTFMFDTIVESESLVESILVADRKAIVGRELYDDAYFAALLAGARPVLEKRLSDSATGVASAVVAAWIEAGRPALPPSRVRTPGRIGGL